MGYETGYWNDVACDVSSDNWTGSRIKGYVIEYGTASTSSTYGADVDLRTQTLFGTYSMWSFMPTTKPAMTTSSKPRTSLLNKIKLFFKPIKPVPEEVTFRGGVARPKGQGCSGPLAQLTLGIKVPSYIKYANGDRFSFYLTSSTNRVLPLQPCSQIQGRTLTVPMSVPVIRDFKDGQRLNVTALIPLQKGAEVTLNVITQEKQPDGTYRLKRGITKSFTSP